MDIEIFYHIADINVWQQHTEEQIDYMRKSGLWDNASRIHLQLHYDPLSFVDWVKQFESDSRITYTIFPHETRPYAEINSMVELANEMYNRDKKVAVFRYHTKGLTYRPSNTWPLSKAWLDYYNYWNIDHWYLCHQALAVGYDTVGANWHSDENIKGVQGHWSGNIWWASSDYLKTLHRLKTPFDAGFKKQLGGYDARHDSELWIGASRKKVKKLELHHYEHGCVYNVPPPSNYRLS